MSGAQKFRDSRGWPSSVPDLGLRLTLLGRGGPSGPAPWPAASGGLLESLPAEDTGAPPVAPGRRLSLGSLVLSFPSVSGNPAARQMAPRPVPACREHLGGGGVRGFQRAPQDVLTPSPQSLANCRPVSYSAPGAAEPDAGRLQSQALNTEFYAGGIRPFIFRAPSEENRKLALKTRTLDGFWSRAFTGEDRGPGVGGRGRSRLVGSCASPVALLG